MKIYNFFNNLLPLTDPLTPMYDRDRISPSLQYQYNIKQTSDENKYRY